MPVVKGPEKPKASQDGELAPAKEQVAASAQPVRRPRWLQATIIGLGAVAILQAGVIGVLILLRPKPQQTPPREITLGQFRFTAGPEDPGRLRGCEFRVSVLLDRQWQASAASRMQEEPSRFRQAVEELLREARSTDFADTSLRHLRLHIKEKLNEALGVAAVAEVLITDWRPEWGEPPSGSPACQPSQGEDFPPSPNVQL
ncbi:MAG: hypothetical protein NZ899_09275 [Thermoguttaceae bacterium]|nr:hypothetical protein [Thermoguttaceae bacterium]MDW8079356.1 hypothetical protein [Thermoguttaceae bacterium]